jgi:hypothetical protein
MAWNKGNEQKHEFEGRIEHVTEKSRLVEDTESGVRYWLPKSQTYDFNKTGEDTYLFAVYDWWWKKKGDFVVQDRE